LNIDEKKKTIRVQSGTTWKQVQDAADPYGLAVKVMQSSNIFTVGGSLSVNAHGRDVRYGPLIETVNSFRLLTAEGEIVNVSREENAELFYSVIGGYGLFGIILDVDLQLTDNVVYEENHHVMDFINYPEFLKAQVLGNPNTHLHIARLSTAPSTFLTDMYATNYTELKDPSNQLVQEAAFALKEEEKSIKRNKLLLDLARNSDWGKERFWDLQKAFYRPDKRGFLSRNNAMGPDILFLEYESDEDTDILQEYFIPMDRFVPFVDGIREIIQENNLNVFNITVRYLPKNKEAILSYSNEDMLALVLLINHELSEKERKRVEQTTQKLVDAALTFGGTYYLPYQLYPTRQQLENAYPKFEEFSRLKLKYDPEEMFKNNFYERYAK
jgi:decaprenylphospho-beta-D-ribofuranose 2-oxidase